ncbi:uncharacterized protein NP_2084A [Natronomonas pharaonis DSM 2160]|uniref:Uncharacterized protein n=1 Tax=Natronomonas pharaonis (strain ATCC 35678 / DSM 2160 / CIP 103997 / JCM 8858 / NBRC 14720 / NCIMB 2260 / Gabara) TaxID=348780 RepID=A0A1U7EVQ8_NATPD|nr:hypothetical protein [Natronomonas pharaonis]CAI49133.1 uncharacterized protein NP_2084A [Natronomonas pharaonis DSM 2160]
MATAVKIDDETKSKLEELQADIRRKTGSKVTQQAILSKLVGSAIDSRSEVVDSFRKTDRSLSETAIQQFNTGQIASGIETDEENIDDALYW